MDRSFHEREDQKTLSQQQTPNIMSQGRLQINMHSRERRLRERHSWEREHPARTKIETCGQDGRAPGKSVSAKIVRGYVCCENRGEQVQEIHHPVSGISG
jgi:hypothetical protein